MCTKTTCFVYKVVPVTLSKLLRTEKNWMFKKKKCIFPNPLLTNRLDFNLRVTEGIILYNTEVGNTLWISCFSITRVFLDGAHPYNPLCLTHLLTSKVRPVTQAALPCIARSSGLLDLLIIVLSFVFFLARHASLHEKKLFLCIFPFR